MESQLEAIGLTQPQAKIYIYLLKFPEGRKPSQIAEEINLTRTNCYKVLEQLTNFNLVRSADVSKTLTFYAEDPIALTSFVARARNHALELEKQVKASMGSLRQKYEKHATKSTVTSSSGRPAIVHAYQRQISSRKDIYFIKSRADVPFLGYETMHKIRSAPSTLGVSRFGITQDAPEAPIDHIHDARTNLKRTWMPSESYTSPVEWTIAGDELTILSFTGSGEAIHITDKLITHSFLEIWKLLDTCLRESPNYSKLPRNAERAI